jgi:hypothetical protein
MTVHPCLQQCVWLYRFVGSMCAGLCRNGFQSRQELLKDGD